MSDPITALLESERRFRDRLCVHPGDAALKRVIKHLRMRAETAEAELASLKAAMGKPVAWIPAQRWNRMEGAGPWLTNIVYSEDQSQFFRCIPLYAIENGEAGNHD
ncbi:hypothetical protein ACC806_34695 [Rhizobium ruizarguesonis]